MAETWLGIVIFVIPVFLNAFIPIVVIEDGSVMAVRDRQSINAEGETWVTFGPIVTLDSAVHPLKIPVSVLFPPITTVVNFVKFSKSILSNA